MKIFYAISTFAALALTSCGGGTAPAEPAHTAETPAEEGAATADAKPIAQVKTLSNVVSCKAIKSINDLTGYYVGMFGKNKINMVIDEITETTIKGRSIVAGNDRPFSGTVAKEPSGILYKITAKEPGDDTFDGAFDLRLMTATKEDGIKLAGTWTANNKKYGKKEFSLQKQLFKYDTKNGMFPFTSERELTEKDVENRDKYELGIMRNEMYARHGYCFKNKEMRKYFDEQAWYMPMNVDIRTELSPAETKNEELLKRYEKYAADYYDEFGR
jgi:YARHG domain